MNKKQRLLMVTSTLLILLTLFFSSEPLKISGNESAETFDLRKYIPIVWKGESQQAGKLIFGMSPNRSTAPSPTQYSVPNVRLLMDLGDPTDPENTQKVISHTHMQTNGDTNTTSTLNIVETMLEYGANPDVKEGAANLGRGITSFPDGGSISGNAIVAEGSKAESDDFKIKLEMTPDANNTRVYHTFTIENISSETKTIYPVKQVDTMLANNDTVPVYARGDNTGMYIETAEYEGGQPIEGGPTYRLDYITDVPNGPIAYNGEHQINLFTTVFGDDMANPTNTVENMATGEVVYAGDTGNDSGMFMAWGEQVLTAGESVVISYAVGFSALAPVELTKTVTNKTSPDEFSRIEDELEYTVTVKNDTDNVFEKAEFVDTLPADVEKPTEITVIDHEGVEIPQELTVYDEESHTITVSGLDLPARSQISLRYVVKVKESGAGKTLTNTVKLTAIDQNGSTMEAETSLDVPILDLGKVIIHYQDTETNGIAEDKIIEGSVGDKYEEEPIEIFGYAYKSTTGQATGKITKEDQVVTFVYEKQDTYQLIQKVTNASGDDMDKQDVGISEELTYQGSLIPDTTNLSEEEMATLYKEATITEKIDENLTDVKEMTLTTSDGVAVGTASYDADNHAVTGIITEADQLKLTESLILTYKATVKAEAQIGTEIKQKASAKVIYLLDENLVIPGVSNEVVSIVNRGELIFESAPEILGFGDDNKISSKDEEIELVTKDQDLSVKDLRGKGNQWSMTVRLVKELTNGDSLLAESMYYLKDGKEQVINENNSAAVYEKTTDSADSIHISEEWSGKNKPILKVRAGTARIGNYQGTIQWSLQDVPNLE
ncbi:MucBP domain-containing protein [Vagococcus salmoninarum]|uniref:DUF11 domain-containing protein n=1 Tax=Vagococcus salmoninarum TaxID=2739 RepID=A0A429ZWC6_9ENTE|nr:MucBP domain-containing protein [Vagococcus salmoninarum]RST97965.1 hypothetical protein CBF35_01340 [Vagococcus salmoninarum]